jgi:hypothetical protein
MNDKNELACEIKKTYIYINELKLLNAKTELHEERMQTTRSRNLNQIIHRLKMSFKLILEIFNRVTERHNNTVNPEFWQKEIDRTIFS